LTRGMDSRHELSTKDKIHIFSKIAALQRHWEHANYLGGFNFVLERGGTSAARKWMCRVHANR